MNKEKEIDGAEDWTLVLGPHSGLFKLRLGDLWSYRDLLIMFVRRDLLSQYKQTILGPLWFFIQPLFTTLIFTFLFGNIAKLPTDGVPKILFYLSGIVAWNYFSECLLKTSQTLIANAGIFGKVYFPRLIIPLSGLVSSLAKFSVQFLLLILFFLYYYFQGAILNPNKLIFAIPLLLLTMAFLGFGVGIIISALTIKYRDLQFLVGFALQLMMYLSPVVYPLSFLSDSMRWLVLINPMTSILETFKYALLGSGSFQPWQLLYSCCFALILTFAGLVIFHRVEQTFNDSI